jgi:L-asparagine oxygenase
MAQRMFPTVEPGGGGATWLGEVALSGAEQARLTSVVRELADRYGSADNPQLLRDVRYLGYHLPPALREALSGLRYEESIAGLVVRGSPVTERPGPTPVRYGEGTGTTAHDLWLLLVAGQLGDPVCWSVWQDGRLVNDILPMPGEEDAQTGLGSEAELEFHVEEALYDNRCDVLALSCLRNNDRVPTTVASVDCLDLASLDLEVLFQPRFRIGGDDMYRDRPVLFGSADSPYLRLDPPYMRALPGDDRAAQALAVLCQGLAGGMVDVVLNAGDLLLLDNYRAVHGRRAFQGRYDGTDRWLRRCTTIRDMRLTRSMRDGPDGRVIVPDVG